MAAFGEYPATKIILELEQDDLLPALLFRTSRRQCDIDVERVGGSRGCDLAPAKQRALLDEVNRVIAKYAFEESAIREHPHYESLLRTGVGAHHAGQLLIWRLLLEELMSKSLLRMMIATGTVAAGVDFPARTVVVSAHSKAGAEGFNVLTSSEFQQMAGRAGRRGKDSVGFCIVAPTPFADARILSEVSRRPPEPLRSAYFAAPATLLNLLKFRSVDDLRYLVGKSFASFLDRKSADGLRMKAREDEERGVAGPGRDRKKFDKRIRRELREADMLEARQSTQLERALTGLERLGHVSNGRLTEKGQWTAHLCTGLVLELSEAIHRGLFEQVSAEELVGLVASISGDAYRRYFTLRDNPVRKELFARMKETITYVRGMYQNPLTSEVEVVPDAATTVVTWMQSQTWSEFAGLLRLGGIAEGDVSRLVGQTADHLNQMARLSESHPDLARAAEEARMCLVRPPLSETLQIVNAGAA